MKKTLLIVFGGFVLVLLSFAIFSYTVTKKVHLNHILLSNIDKNAELIQEHKEYVLQFATHTSLFDSTVVNQGYVQNQLETFNRTQIRRAKINIPRNSNVRFYLHQNSNIESQLFHAIGKLGFKEHGVLGEMRSSIHQAETKYPAIEKDLLLMRRHEKDFIMRLDDSYALKHKAVFDRLNKSMANNPELVNYEKQFVEAQLLFHQIYSDESALFTKWQKNIELVQAEIRQERSKLVAKSSELSNSALNTQLFLSLVILIILIGTSYWCISRFTRQVNSLQKSMNDFVESKYKNRNFNMTIPKNEIGQLMKRFLQLARKIEIEVRYLEERVDNRTKSLRHKNEILEYQHNEIVQSLNYAQNLQQSLLVSHRRISQQFKDSCVHYSPKNLVGGDFYWMKTFKRGKAEMILFALADCTGHGVPGALISVLGMNTLDELYGNGATNPATLLNQLRLVISRRFNTENEQRLDGMDISVFLLNKRSGKLTFAGAQMPLWLIRKTETLELKGQRLPIGLSYGKTEPFTNQVLQLESGDKILLFTDGLTDQFGDVIQKKWGKKGLRKSIFMRNEKSTQQIFHSIMRDFDHWKQNQDQTDDCAVLLFEFELQQEVQIAESTLIPLNTPNLQAHG